MSVIDLRSLQHQYPDVRGWLTIPEVGIDYPVMQGEDNNEYLNKDPFGDYSLAGSIFLDSRNNPKFDDYYSLVYGHHMEQGMMFGALDDYLKEGYLDSHSSGTLTVGDDKYKLRFFAVLECEATEPSIFAPTENDDETLDYIKQNALFLDDNALPDKDEKILGLSTCKYPDTVERTLILLLCHQKVNNSRLRLRVLFVQLTKSQKTRCPVYYRAPF